MRWMSSCDGSVIRKLSVIYLRGVELVNAMAPCICKLKATAIISLITNPSNAVDHL
jgi:hypothetical protein